MRIRGKVIFIVIPLIVVPLVLVGFSSILSARNGITQVATAFLRFKSEELKKYAESQWNLLVENDLSSDPTFVNAAKTVIESFAISLIRSETELILGVDTGGKTVLRSRIVDVSPSEIDALLSPNGEEIDGWRQIYLEGISRVAQGITLTQLGWHIFVTEHRGVFYKSVDRIVVQSVIILSSSVFVSLILLLAFMTYITNPVRSLAGAMRDIIVTNDLSKKVAVQYRDEIGDLGHTFNLMIAELDKANKHIKSYALRAVVAQKKEQRIRNIFQKYVPKNVIDRFFENPSDMLEGENRVLAVLFSDIRDFTTISESMPSRDIVDSLNRYFGLMVDIIMEHDGIVDKYIGDSIMAFYGAPVTHNDDAIKALQSAFDMADALVTFNDRQAEQGRPRFATGVGINYGEVTVGNIGSQKKMDYTVVGDMVNVASRLEGLTKVYKEPIIISEELKIHVESDFRCRKIDKVAVKGKSTGSAIYAVRKSLSAREEKAWKLHEMALDQYYNRDFAGSESAFATVKQFLGTDKISDLFIARCKKYQQKPPGEDWVGLVAMETK